MRPDTIYHVAIAALAVLALGMSGLVYLLGRAIERDHEERL